MSLKESILGVWKSEPGGQEFSILTFLEDAKGSLRTSGDSGTSVIDFSWIVSDERQEIKLDKSPASEIVYDSFLFITPLRISFNPAQSAREDETLVFTSTLSSGGGGGNPGDVVPRQRHFWRKAINLNSTRQP